LKDTLLTYTAAAEDQDAVLRDILKDRFNLSQALTARLKWQYRIKVNGQWSRTNHRIRPGDVITVDVDFSEENLIVAENLPLDIVYEDEDFLVVNKPSGMAIHPSKSGGTGTLANAVTFDWQKAGIHTLFRAINRLDKDTSGLVLIGKTQFAHQGVFVQDEQRGIRKRYIALAEGLISEDSGTINQPIACLDPAKRQRTVHPNGQPAITHYKVLERLPGHTLLSFELETGRTHQIRVHMLYMGHPLCSDPLYGHPSPWISRLALHAYEMTLIHPRSGKEIILQLPLSADIQSAVDRLRI